MTTTQSRSSAIKGILGTKLGMTQVFDSQNKIVPVTVIEAGPCVVTQIRTLEKDGYTAVQLAFGAIEPRKISKPLAGQFARLVLHHVLRLQNFASLQLKVIQ